MAAAISPTVADLPVQDPPQASRAAASKAAAPAPAEVEVPADDSEGPEWPDEAVESAMRAEHTERDDSSVLAPAKSVKADRAGDPEEDAAPLPTLDALIEQIPPAVRDTLEELFRARFTSVQRVPKAALK